VSCNFGSREKEFSMSRHCAHCAHGKIGAIYAQPKFISFISTPMPDNLGQPKLGKHGGKRTKGQQGDNVTLRSRGNSREYILARLEREGLTDWIEAILLRKISAFAVAVELGWAKRPQTLSGENCNQARQRAFDIRALIG